VRLSLSITSYAWRSGPVAIRAERPRIASAAESAGLDTVWVTDHLTGAETIPRRLAVLARHGDALGRPYDDIEKSVCSRVEACEPPDQLAERCAGLAALGLQHAVFLTSGRWSEGAVARLGAARERLDA
jgi:hypothetical protein